MNAMDVCAGAAGGWSLGLHRAGVNTVAACEAVAWRRDLYAANFPGVKLYDDLRTLTGDQLRRDRIRVDLLAGSPPCKEYSSIGAGGGLDADDLFLQVVRLAGELRPRWICTENSSHIKVRGYDRIASALEAINYTCWPMVVGAGNAGAASRRPRAFIVAWDSSRPQGRPSRLTRPDRGMGGRAPGRRCGDGERSPGHPLPRLGPIGTERLGGHLRSYDGVPARLAEQCREAYGDAVLPQLTEVIGRSILAIDAELACR